MGRQVPLVTYVNGSRIHLGMANVEESGAIEAQIMKDKLLEARDLILPPIFEVVLAPKVGVRPIPYNEKH